MIRAWARNDPEAKATARKVTKLRVDFIGEILEELGSDEEAEVRTLLFLSDHTWEKTMFDWAPERKIESLAELRLELLPRQG